MARQLRALLSSQTSKFHLASHKLAKLAPASVTNQFEDQSFRIF